MRSDAAIRSAAQARMEEHLDCGSQRMKDVLLRGQFSAVGVD